MPAMSAIPAITPMAAPPRAASALSRYLFEIRAIPRHSREREAEIGARIEAGVAGSHEELIVANLSFVVKIASEYQNLGLPLDDLVNEGNIGLMLAAARFDPRRGVRFITYASFWVRKAIVRALDEQGSVVRVPAYQRLKAMRECGAPPARPSEPWVAAPRRTISLDEEPPGDRSRRLADTLADARSADPEREVARQERLALLWRCLSALSDRDRRVILWRFGLHGGQALTLTEVSGRLGVSRERVRQIETAARGRLRVLLERAG